MSKPIPIADAPILSAAAAANAAEARSGVLYGLACYGSWGLVPVYFKAVAHVPAPELLAHRVVWSFALLALLMRAKNRWPEALRALGSRRTIATLVASTLLIATNWFVFIWAVAHDRMLESSLGYFINPLVNVLLGVVFLRERLRPGQIAGVLLAAAGVGYLAFSQGRLPAVALLLAVTFGLYGLLRKVAKVDALVGLAVETSFLVLPGLGWLAVVAAAGHSSFGRHSRGLDLLLAASGIVTAVPLLCFANAARRLRLSTVGILQYISPSVQFLLAVLAYGEAFTAKHAVAFGCIWTALVVYSIEAVATSRRAAPTLATSPPAAAAAAAPAAMGVADLS